MIILLNASNLKKGGGIQVGDSLCCSLNKYHQHKFIVVCSSFMKSTLDRISDYSNVVSYEYTMTYKSPFLLMFGRDKFMDDLVERYNVDCVLSVFGPVVWVPKCAHVSGFARPHLVIPESPYYSRFSRKELLIEKFRNIILKICFERTAKVYFTENPFISQRLEKLIPSAKVFTVTNFYNQIFDHPEQWKQVVLPEFDGTPLLTVSAAYPHKNMEIAVDVAKILKEEHPEFKFRFVYTINQNDLNIESNGVNEKLLAEHFVFTGKVDISQCPSLYSQADIEFMPTLLECFTATYPEAMRMNLPIITTDVEFARGLCKDAAVYYKPLSAKDAADTIYNVATNKVLMNELINNGKRRLEDFDNYEQRCDKIIQLVEGCVSDGYGMTGGVNNVPNVCS